MDVLSNISIAGFKLWLWIVASLAGLATFFLSKRSDRHRIAQAIVRAIYVAGLTIAIGCMAVVFYILSHATDPRWSVGKTPLLQPNQATSDVPLIGGIVDAFNGLQNTVTGAANNAIAIQNAINSLPDFFTLGFWAAVVAVASRIVLGRMLAWDEKRRERVRVRAEEERERRLNRQRDAIWELQREKGIEPWQNL